MFWSQKKEKISVEQLWANKLQPLLEDAIAEASGIASQHDISVTKEDLALNIDVLFFHLFGKVLSQVRIVGLLDHQFDMGGVMVSKEFGMLVHYPNNYIAEKYGESDDIIPTLEKLKDIRTEKVPVYQKFEEGLSKDDILEDDFGLMVASLLFDINDLKEIPVELARSSAVFHKSLFLTLWNECKKFSRQLEIIPEL